MHKTPVRIRYKSRRLLLTTLFIAIVFLRPYLLSGVTVWANDEKPVPRPFPSPAYQPRMASFRFNENRLPRYGWDSLATYNALLGISPDEPAGGGNQIVAVRDLNQNSLVIMYRLITHVPNGFLVTKLPFYPKGSLVNVNEWTEANLSEDIFMHASDPAGISFSQKEEPDNLTIYWLSD